MDAATRKKFIAALNEIEPRLMPGPHPVKPIHILSPIDLPEKKTGRINITHRFVKDKIEIIGSRQAFTRGLQPVMLKLIQPLKITTLSDKKSGVWMTDLPEELFQIHSMLETVQPRGHVLIGGLGLGIAALMVNQHPGVKSVTIIEKDADIIELCAPQHLKKNIICADITDYLKSHKEKFNCYLLDTWRGTNEMTYWREVFPLRRIIRNRFGLRPVVHCWAEDIMRGQVERVLRGPNRHWKYQDLPPMTQAIAERFTENVGTKTWEKIYGETVDANLNRR